MKTLIILSLTFFTMAACSNENQHAESKTQDTAKVYLEVLSGQTLRYQLATGIATEGGFSIVSEPQHAKVSKIEWNKDAKQLEYIYQPKAGFTGADQVKIKEVISIGDSENNTTRNVAITIDVK